MVFFMAGIILAPVTPVRDRSILTRRIRRAGALTAALLAAAAIGPPVHAQIVVGRIAGKVIDETGAPVPEATVRAESPTASPGSLTGTTNGKGEFAILGLRSGQWTVTVTAAGFEPAEFNLPVRNRTNVPSMRVTLRRSRRGARSQLTEVDVEAFQASLGEAAALAADGRIDEALSIYERLVEIVPALTSIHRTMGDLYVLKKDRVRALEAYQRLKDAEPDDEEAAAAVASVALALGLEAEAAGDREAAIRYLEQAVAAAPDGPGAAEARAALARLKQP